MLEEGPIRPVLYTQTGSSKPRWKPRPLQLGRMTGDVATEEDLIPVRKGQDTTGEMEIDGMIGIGKGTEETEETETEKGETTETGGRRDDLGTRIMQSLEVEVGIEIGMTMVRDEEEGSTGIIR